MSRVTPLPRSELPEAFAVMLEQAEAGGGNPVLAQVMALCPELFGSYFRFYYRAHEDGLVEPSTKELARLKVARLNGCATCGNARYASAMSSGLTEERIARLDLPEAEAALAPRERLAVRFAERLARDHASIDDAFVDELRGAFSDAEIVELAMMIGQYIGFGRALVALGLGEAETAPYWATRHRNASAGGDGS